LGPPSYLRFSPPSSFFSFFSPPIGFSLQTSPPLAFFCKFFPMITKPFALFLPMLHFLPPAPMSGNSLQKPNGKSQAVTLPPTPPWGWSSSGLPPFFSTELHYKLAPKVNNLFLFPNSPPEGSNTFPPANGLTGSPLPLALGCRHCPERFAVMAPLHSEEPMLPTNSYFSFFKTRQGPLGLLDPPSQKKVACLLAFPLDFSPFCLFFSAANFVTSPPALKKPWSPTSPLFHFQVSPLCGIYSPPLCW